jgi:hypothetical protein
MASLLAGNVSKYFSHSFLENELNLISQSLSIKVHNTFIPHSTLHIMTQAYGTGGHTKLVEQWIKNFDFKHNNSVVLINHKSDTPESLKKTVEQNGRIYKLKEKFDILKKAEELAYLSSQFENVILHIHPYDILSNLAFSNVNFTRPIFFMNHADHMFSVGYSLANTILELSEDGMNFSKNYRGVINSNIVRIPIEKNDNLENISKEQARKHLNISIDKKIVLSIASEFKYGDGKDFIEMAKKIVFFGEDTEFILIGPSQNTAIWKSAFLESSGKIKPIGVQPREELKYYIKASDLYIESFPFASYTAFLDVVAYNINSITLKTPVHTMDLIKKSNCVANDIGSLIEKANEILSKKNNNVYIPSLNAHYKEEWIKNLIEVINGYKNITHKTNLLSMKYASADYCNFITKIMKSTLPFGTVYKKLPFFIKLQLYIKLYKMELITKKKLKAFSKTLFPY